MSKRILLYTTFGFFLYLFFLVVTLPASWFAWGINRYTQGMVRLNPYSGSIWRGTGQLIVYYPSTVPHEFKNIAWRLNPLWLFTGKAHMNWRTTGASDEKKIDLTVRLGNGQVRLFSSEMALPASLAASMFPPASFISPQGRLLLHTEELTLGDGLTGNVEIKWENASSTLTTVQPLGTYRLEIKGTGQTADLRLNTLQGSLELQGQGQWQAKTGQVQLTGVASAREHAGELESLLKLIGTVQGPGRYAMTLNVPLTPPARNSQNTAVPPPKTR